MDQIMFPLTIAAVIGFVLYMIGVNRKPSTSAVGKPSNLVTFGVNATGAEVQKAILQYSQMSGLNMEQVDPARGVIVLGEDMGILKTHNGYWLKFYINDLANGYCNVEVAISSKTFQAGFMLTPMRDKAANAVKAALMINGRTVGQPFAITPSVVQHSAPPPTPRPNIINTRRP